MGNTPDGCVSPLLPDNNDDPRDELKLKLRSNSDGVINSKTNENDKIIHKKSKTKNRHNSVPNIKTEKYRKHRKHRKHTNHHKKPAAVTIIIKDLRIEIGELEHELDRKNHQNKLLKQENRSLRAENAYLKSKYDVNDDSISVLSATNNVAGLRTNHSQRPPIHHQPTLPSITESPQVSFDVYEDDKHDECCSISKCRKIECMIIALKWYNLFSDDTDRLYKKIRETKYDKNLLNDYDHLLKKHFVAESPLIRQLMHDEIKNCNKSNCDGLKRLKIKIKNGSVGVNKLSLGHKQSYIDCLDFIHCYLLHPHQLT